MIFVMLGTLDVHLNEIIGFEFQTSGIQNELNGGMIQMYILDRSFPFIWKLNEYLELVFT